MVVVVVVEITSALLCLPPTLPHPPPPPSCYVVIIAPIKQPRVRTTILLQRIAIMEAVVFYRILLDLPPKQKQRLRQKEGKRLRQLRHLQPRPEKLLLKQPRQTKSLFLPPPRRRRHRVITRQKLTVLRARRWGCADLSNCGAWTTWMLAVSGRGTGMGASNCRP